MTIHKWTTKDGVLTIGRTVLLGATWFAATACADFTGDGGLVALPEEALALDLPEHCEATLTASGYTITCDQASGGAVAQVVAVPAPAESGGCAGAPSGEEASAPAGGPVAALFGEGGNEGAPLGEDGFASLVIPDIAFCDQPLYEGAEWVSVAGTHITLYALEGTAAATDSPDLLERHETAYLDVQSALGLVDGPQIDLVVSPNRAAAAYRGLDFGLAIPGLGRIEAVYDGAPDAYLAQHPGYLVTASLLGNLLPADQVALPLLGTGLAEHLDGSGRDLHLAYATAVVTSVDGPMTMGELGQADVWGYSSAAGSLVAFMVDQYGMNQVMNLVQATAVTWEGEAYFHEDVGAIDSVESLEALLGDAVIETMGQSWEELRSAWQGEVLTRFAAPLPEVTGEDRDAILNLVAVADAALNGDDVNAYRAVMDGYYCEAFDDAARLDTATDMTQAFANVETQVLKVYPTATRNYKTARVLATRDQGTGEVSTTYYDVEHFPMGWRITGTPEW